MCFEKTKNPNAMAMWIQYWVHLETFTQAVLPLRWRPFASNIFEAGFVVILSLIANDDVHDKP